MDAAFKDAATPNYALLAGGIGVVVIAGAVLAYAVTVRRRSK
jgi:Flp pilus assembly pilin Flp